jgi:hypothetical protein
MTTIFLIVFSMLGVWWCLLSLFLAWNYYGQLREKKTLLTLEQKEELKEFNASLPRYHLRRRDYLLFSPFFLIWLPFYLYYWLVENPHDKFERLSADHDDKK